MWVTKWRREHWNCHLVVIIFIFTKEICMWTSFYLKPDRDPHAVIELVWWTAFCYENVSDHCIPYSSDFLNGTGGSQWGWLCMQEYLRIGSNFIFVMQRRGKRESPRMHSRKIDVTSSTWKSGKLLDGKLPGAF